MKLGRRKGVSERDRTEIKRRRPYRPSPIASQEKRKREPVTSGQKGGQLRPRANIEKGEAEFRTSREGEGRREEKESVVRVLSKDTERVCHDLYGEWKGKQFSLTKSTMGKRGRNDDRDQEDKITHSNH